MVQETLHRLLLKEYHEQYRIPFKEYGEGHAFIDEFIDWIQYASQKGTLPKPKITFEEGIKKGCAEYAKKTGNDISQIEKLFYDKLEQEALTFDKNGNVYVERAITMQLPYGGLNGKTEKLYNELINAYEKNVGGCWSYKKGMGKAYCGDDGMKFVFKGYMFLDDVYWTEFIRLELRGLNEKEIRTYPNGRVQLMEIVVDDKTLTTKSFDGPRILNSTYFGNNQKYGKAGFAKLGYQRIGYDKQYIDREGNEYTFDAFADLVQKKLQSGARPEDVFDKVAEYRDGFARVKLSGKWNYIDTNVNLVSPKQWFDYCNNFNGGFAIIELNDKENIINANGELFVGDFNSTDNWFDRCSPFLEGFAVIINKGKCNLINQNRQLITDFPTADESIKGEWFDNCYSFKDGLAVVQLNRKENYIDTEGNLLSPNQWFDECNGFYNGIAVVKLNEKQNYIDIEGNLIYPNQWFDECYSFNNGIARVKLNGTVYLTDAEGNLYDYETGQPLNMNVKTMNSQNETVRKNEFTKMISENIINRIRMLLI